MKNILFVHQSAELYGSDRVLLSLVTELKKDRFRPVVILPSEGPLMGRLRESGIETHVAPLVRIARDSFHPKTLVSLPRTLGTSLRAMNNLCRGFRVDLVHSNTLAVLSGAVWARWNRCPHIWHIHEIVEHPWAAKRLLPVMAGMLSTKVVSNSEATRRWLVGSQPRLAEKTVTIWNGLDRVAPPVLGVATELREKLGIGRDGLLLALVGRINRWKGHPVFVEAAEELWKRGNRRVHFLIAGSPPLGQERYRQELLRRIECSPAKGNISVMDFCENAWPIWDACDIAVVPSTEPEPFGMVAIEAMAAGKPVIGTAHGGLTEIIVPGETGLLVAPGDAQSLAEGIGALAADGELRRQMGARGQERQREYFSLDTYVSRFKALYETI